MKLYDCFTFYNELDLLELRLAELYNTVDHFVIVESNQTFTNRPKPFLFEENKQRYSQYLDKIIHVKVNDMPGSVNPWANEWHQRNAIMRGLTDAKSNDIVFISDVDEVLRKQAVEHVRNSNQLLFALRMPIFNFKFNYIKVNPDRYNIWAMAARRSVFSDISPNSLRDMRFNFFGCDYQFSNQGCEVIEHGGWHFGYLGDREYLIDKVKSFSHQEANTPEFIAQIDPDASIAKRASWQQDGGDVYEIVELDDYFPKYLLENQNKYQQYILNNPVTTARALLPDVPYSIT